MQPSKNQTNFLHGLTNNTQTKLAIFSRKSNFLVGSKQFSCFYSFNACLTPWAFLAFLINLSTLVGLGLGSSASACSDRVFHHIPFQIPTGMVTLAVPKRPFCGVQNPCSRVVACPSETWDNLLCCSVLVFVCCVEVRVAFGVPFCLFFFLLWVALTPNYSSCRSSIPCFFQFLSPLCVWLEPLPPAPPPPLTPLPRPVPHP